jgi:hypothetical protein
MCRGYAAMCSFPHLVRAAEGPERALVSDLAGSAVRDRVWLALAAAALLGALVVGGALRGRDDLPASAPKRS